MQAPPALLNDLPAGADERADSPREGSENARPDGGAKAIPATVDRFHGLVFRGVAPISKAPGASPRAFPVFSGGTPKTTEIAENFDAAELAFVRLALRCVGLDPESYRSTPLVRRVPACLRALRLDSVEEASRMVMVSPEKAILAVNSLLIGTTGFFRDPLVFAELESTVIPRLLETRRYPRVWSAACSDGSELYSVAMMLADHGRLVTGQLKGTDCRESCVRAGRRGFYSNTAMEGMPTARLGRYFEARRGGFEVKPELRAAAFWQMEDLTRDFQKGDSYDLIFCRNVAIYLDPEAVLALWRRLAAILTPGGYLVVGKAEKISLPSLQRVSPCIYLKTTA